MDLASIIVPSKTVKMEYPGFPELFFNVAYLTRDELMDLRKKATTQKFNRKTRQPEEEVDSDLFQDIYIQAVIKGWTGFKYKYLLKMIPVNVASIPVDEYQDGEGEFVFTKENATVLMKNYSDLDNWISAQLEDVELFTQTN